jgi:stage IV sporulation protein FB
MGWAFKLAEFGGTSVRVHYTFLLLLAWLGTVFWLQGGPVAALDGLLFILLLFACVVLHEFGHVLAARRYGIHTRDITLLPIGGVAALDRMPEKPAQEIAVALAGPAVNFAIAGILMLIFGARLNLLAPQVSADFGSNLESRLATVNLALAVFNLIPAFPMDGGRVLRALLGFAMSYGKATQVAARVGQGLAIALGFLGLFGNPLLVLIAVFIFLAASAEAYSVNVRDLARGRLASDVMITEFESLQPGSYIDQGAALLLKTTQQEFPVVDGARRLRGLLTRQAIIEALNAGGGQTPVLQAMTRDIPVRPARASLDGIVSLLQDKAAPAVGIVDSEERLIGYVTKENMAEFFMLMSAGMQAGGGSNPSGEALNQDADAVR